jgi:phosphoribosylanthranilate isomerase
MRTRIKICGLTRAEDIDACVEAGVDAVGFVFYAKSPRAITPEKARELVRRLPAWMSAVGLFVNAGREEILQAADQSGISHIQLHGDETADDCHGLGRPVIKAIRVRPTPTPESFDLERSRLDSLLAEFSGVAAPLFDADSPAFGGSGQGFDWRLLSSLAGPSAQNSLGPNPTWVLSGGLESGSVGKAIADLTPPCVDVSSGVELRHNGELRRGLKDASRIRDFVAAVVAADQPSD